jgi:hypothetical protein
MQIIKYATQLANVGKSKNEMNASETAITNMVAAIPNIGCFNPSTVPPHETQRDSTTKTKGRELLPIRGLIQRLKRTVIDCSRWRRHR